MNARSWTQPLAPPLVPPDRFMHLRLLQADAWLNDSGVWEPVSALASVELWSILGYLRWHAPALAAEDPAAAVYADLDPYIASRPIVAAIDAVLTERGEIASGTALGVLRALGVAPWELPPRGARRRRTASS